MSISKEMPNLVGTRHVGIAAKDPAALVPFYRDVLGMTLVRQTPADSPIGTTVFLSRHPEGEEDHDLVIFPNPVFAHIAFEVATLAELKAAYHAVKERVPIKFAFNHALALSFYFDDPEGTNLEIYWSTTPDARVRQKVAATRIFAQPVDLDLPEEELLRQVKHLFELMESGAELPPQPGMWQVEGQQQQQGISGGKGELVWTKEAESELKSAPFFVRARAKNGIEEYARAHGITEITPEVMRDARKTAGIDRTM
jgi:catechol 2,3-dioxygenase-like lactoylglutathione lyase family enzyme